MQDGQYDFEFVALDRVRRGTLRIERNLVAGSDDVHAISGQVSRAGANVIAAFDVAWKDPDHPPRVEDGADYTIKMFGSGTETDFAVVGIAPLGLIVEMRAVWRSALV